MKGKFPLFAFECHSSCEENEKCALQGKDPLFPQEKKLKKIHD